MPDCEFCKKQKAVLKRPKTGAVICKECFYYQFEYEIHQTIQENHLFTRGEKVAIAASGGKDSTVLAHTVSKLNKQYDYGIELVLVSIDEGIVGYRDDSLETVKRNSKQYDIPLRILSYKDLYGWTMDEIVQEIGRKNNCTFCGVFRRQALDRGAVVVGANKIVTGHNADDIAETVLMNILRGDIARLSRCVSINTGDGAMSRCKPFKYTYEKEIVMYAHFQNLDYFSTECVYSPFAYRGFAREFLKDLEKTKSRSIIDIIRSGEQFVVRGGDDEDSKVKTQKIGVCAQCGYISSQRICKACVLLAGLNRGQAKLGIGRQSVALQRDIVDGGGGSSGNRGGSSGGGASLADVLPVHPHSSLGAADDDYDPDHDPDEGDMPPAHAHAHTHAERKAVDAARPSAATEAASDTQSEQAVSDSASLPSSSGNDPAQPVSRKQQKRLLKKQSKYIGLHGASSVTSNPNVINDW